MKSEEKLTDWKVVVQAWNLFNASNCLETTRILCLIHPLSSTSKIPKPTKKPTTNHHTTKQATHKTKQTHNFNNKFSLTISTVFLNYLWKLTSFIFFSLKCIHLLKIGGFLSWSLNMLAQLSPIQLKVSTANTYLLLFYISQDILIHFLRCSTQSNSSWPRGSSRTK